MSSPSHIPFATPDSPGDATVVLVLLENSGAMHGNWNDIRNSYLPYLLEALRSAQPGAPVHMIWQLATSSYDQAEVEASTMRTTYTEASRYIPNFQFNATNTPLSPTTIRRSIETLRVNVPRDRSCTRHLLVVAMSQPVTTSPGHSHQGYLSGVESWQSIALSLHQDRARLHMILRSSSQLNILLELFYNTLTLQTRAEAPLWFQANPSHVIHLSAKSISLSSADSPTHIPSSASPSVPVTPGITPSSLPLSSPGYESASTSHVLSSSPPTRRSRPKPKETPQAGQASQETSRPQLVEYIKQIHGLTKKRTPGGKAAKKTGAAEQARASSSRPILPRLELPPSNLSVDPKGKATERAALEAASSGGSRYAAIAPAGPARSAAPEEGHRAQSQSPRRWPWLQPAPVPSATPVEERELSPSAAAALRNLQTIAPRLPGMGTHLPGEQHSPPRARRAATYDTHTSHSEETVSTSTSLHRQATYPAPGMSPPPQSGRMHSSQAYHTVAGSQVSQAYEAEHYSGYTPQQYPTFTSPTGHGGMISSSPLPAQDDPENLPFVITAEYEALANAEFEQAVRSGAMQASMTPTALSPVVTSPGMHPAATGYFPSEPVGSGNIMSPSMQQTPTTQTQQTGSGYTSYHPSQQEQHLTGEVVYHQSHGQSPPGTRGPLSSSPPGSMQYYNPDSPPGNDPSQARRWYG